MNPTTTAAAKPAAPRLSLIALAAAALCSSPAHAAPAEDAAAASAAPVAMSGSEIQEVLPGVNPIKALETLPGVSFQTADPWGNNEQNLSLFVHGFNGQQLGYTMDGVPLGDQQYGNYNGLAPQRAVTSENVRSVVLLDKVWHAQGTLDERTVDVHVLRLRKGLRGAGGLLKTVRGHGYKLSAG